MNNQINILSIWTESSTNIRKRIETYEIKIQKIAFVWNMNEIIMNSVPNKSWNQYEI
jgi:hypothetical protein